ncbi:MAG: DNA cytosine methyltransferase [Tenuifilaceae bacterium]|jgi:hypothetical protein|nr:DNA cytosine methyltransferase [Tenuifilaceae bacterium]
MKTLLSLFDYSGNWACPYQENGWNVILWDIKHTTDMFCLFSDINDACADFFYENIFDNFGTVDGIIAAPPCTDFAVSGARWWPEKDRTGSTAKSIELVYQTLRIVDLCQPDFWALENPVGRISKLVPELGSPWYFQPYWFGDPYTKKTGLWGNFTPPAKTNVVEPIIFTNANGKRGSYMWAKLGGKSEKTKELRSETPMGFSYAFYESNH